MEKELDSRVFKNNSDLFFVEPIFTIGYDIDRKTQSYVLCRCIGGKYNIILQKTIYVRSIEEDNKFKEEIDNLAMYFNAKIVTEL